MFGRGLRYFGTSDLGRWVDGLGTSEAPEGVSIMNEIDGGNWRAFRSAFLDGVGVAVMELGKIGGRNDE